jgi:hypothetical protein
MPLDTLDPDAKLALALMDEMLQRGGVALKVTVGNVGLEGQFIIEERPKRPPADSKSSKDERAQADREALERDLYGAT